MTYMENIKTYFHNRDKKDARRYKKIICNNYRKWFLLLVIASVPGTVVGWLFRDLAKLAGGNLLAPGMGLFITGIVLLVADFFPRGKKIPRDHWLFCRIGYRPYPGAYRISGGFTAGYYPGSMPGLWMSEKICGKVCLSAVRACVHRIFYHRMYSYDRRFFGLAGLGRICGRRPGSGSGRLFFHQKSDKGIAE